MLMEVSGKKEEEGMQFDFFKKEHKLDYLVIRKDRGSSVETGS